MDLLSESRNRMKSTKEISAHELSKNMQPEESRTRTPNSVLPNASS
jgi:hypothetical protein